MPGEGLLPRMLKLLLVFFRPFCGSGPLDFRFWYQPNARLRRHWLPMMPASE